MINKHKNTSSKRFGRLRLLLFFLAFSVLVANPKKLLYTVVANPPHGLLDREKITRIESLAAPPPPLHAARSKKIKI